MLACVMAALLLARGGRRRIATLLIAVATAMKLLPCLRAVCAADAAFHRVDLCGMVIAGLVLPYFVWSDYLGIYTFASERKGNDWLDIAGALLLAGPFTALLWYVEKRSSFNDEDRIGWSLVPFALFAGLLANSGRHLLIALIVPDRRAGRNLAAAVTLALHSLFPDVVRLGATVYIAAAALVAVLSYQALRAAPQQSSR